MADDLAQPDQLAQADALAQRLAATLGEHQAALLRAHGGVIVAESVEAVFVDAIHFDENARSQLQAALGRLTPSRLASWRRSTRRPSASGTCARCGAPPWRADGRPAYWTAY